MGTTTAAVTHHPQDSHTLHHLTNRVATTRTIKATEGKTSLNILMTTDSNLNSNAIPKITNIPCKGKEVNQIITEVMIVSLGVVRGEWNSHRMVIGTNRPMVTGISRHQGIIHHRVEETIHSSRVESNSRRAAGDNSNSRASRAEISAREVVGSSSSRLHIIQ